MLRPRLAGGLQGIGQGLFAPAGGVEVVGQVEDAVGGVGLQRQRNAIVQFLAPLGESRASRAARILSWTKTQRMPSGRTHT